MNILILSWRDPKHPQAGGAEQVMHEHMKGWIAAGHTVTFFSSRSRGSKAEEWLDGIRIIRRGSDLFLGVQLEAFWWYLFTDHEKFDIVVDEFHGYPFFTPLFTRIPKLAVLQEVAREVWFLNYLPWPWRWIIGFIGYWTEPLVFLLYKKTPFLVGSLSAKQDLMSFGVPQKNISIVPHGIIKTEKPVNIPRKEERKTIIFLGALTTDKGIEEALEAFGILQKKGNYNFWIVGRGEPLYIKKLKNGCKRLGVINNTTFFGFVSQKRKFQLLGRAHILINPSIREGWGLVNIEANAMGTPVVAYKSPGLVDSVNDGRSGLLCKENTPKDIAKMVTMLLENNKLYTNLQKGAVEWSKRFSWEKSKKLSLDLIERIDEN